MTVYTDHSITKIKSNVLDILIDVLVPQSVSKTPNEYCKNIFQVNDLLQENR